VLCLLYRTFYVTAVLYTQLQCYIAGIVIALCMGIKESVTWYIPDLKFEMTRTPKWRIKTQNRKKRHYRGSVFNVCPIFICSKVDCLKAPWWVSNGFLHVLQLELIKALPYLCYASLCYICLSSHPLFLHYTFYIAITHGSALTNQEFSN